jgi:type I restriction enzyme M protein
MEPSSKIARGDDSKVMSQDNADLFFRCHSVIWSVDHLRPSSALNELCKLIFAKAYDEVNSGGKRFRPSECGSGMTGDEVRALYEEAQEKASELLDLKSPTGVFDEPLQLSDAAIAGVCDLLSRYTITGSGVDVKGAAFQQLTDEAVRSGMGQYFTPEPVVQFMVDVACPTTNDMVLDPFCGSGHFLVACADAVRKHSRTSPPEASRFERERLFGIEKDTEMVRLALVDTLLSPARIHLVNSDSLVEFAQLDNLLGRRLDPRNGGFSLVLTNPPFGKRLPREAIEKLAHFELAPAGRPVPLEVLGLERSISFLRPGGRLVIVLPHSIFTNRSTQQVREFVARTCKVLAIVSLPAATFSRHAGVGQASILFAERRKETDANMTEQYDVYCCSCGSVGYDQTGRPSQQNELPHISREIIGWLQGAVGNLSSGFLVGIDRLVARGFGPEQHLRTSPGHIGKQVSMADLTSRVFTGVSPGRSSFTASGCRILKVGDLTGEGIDWLPSGERAWVDSLFAQKHVDKRLERGDILLTAAAHQRKYVGMKVDIIDELPVKWDLVLCSPEVLVIRPRTDRVSPYYLLAWLRSAQGYLAVQSCIRGQTAHLYPGDVREIRVPVPPSGSVRAISAYEDAIRESLRLREVSKSMALRAAAELYSLISTAPQVAAGISEVDSKASGRRLRQKTLR